MAENMIQPVDRLNNQKGFTLIELMIVVSMIAILATMAMPSFQKSIVRAKETRLKRDLFIMRDMIDQYYADHGAYPDSLEVLAEKKYIRAVPKDPFTLSDTTWIIIPPEGEDIKGGVFDVHSGSDFISLDGVPYNEM